MGRELETASRSECIHGSPPDGGGGVGKSLPFAVASTLPLLPTQCLSPLLTPPLVAVVINLALIQSELSEDVAARCRTANIDAASPGHPPSVGRADVTNSRSGP